LEKLFERIAYGKFYGLSGSLIQVALLPLYFLSIIYKIIIQGRASLYKAGIFKSYNAKVKVISIGNISVGGTGKTPTTQWLAQNLSERGYKTAILSRGYGGKRAEDVSVVSDGESVLLSPQEAGDEPYMLAKKLKGLPVIVGSDRLKLANYACEKYNLDALILDDGFQHIRLKRDVNILLFDGEKGVGNGSALPRGPLREPLSAMGRADLVLINKDGSATEGLKALTKRHAPSIAVFKTSYRTTCIRELGSDETKAIEDLKDMDVTLFSGIANPESFAKTIELLGGVIVSKTSFPDHHDYTVADIDRVSALAEKAGVSAILTTEKDAVKLEQINSPSKVPVYVVEVGLDFQEDSDKLIDMIIKKAGLSEKKDKIHT